MKYSPNYFQSLKEAASLVTSLKELSGKSVIITGATGLIGSAVADVLLCCKTVQVYLAGRSKEKIDERFTHWHGSYEFIPYDCTKDLAWSMDANYIIHCAGNAHPNVYVRQPVETLLDCIVGTHNILQFAKEKSVDRVLYVSSSEIYGEREGNELYKENESFFVNPLDPRSCYPLGKRAAENLCISYLHEYEVDSVIVRPGHVYGPTMTTTDSRAHAQFARNAANHEDILMKSNGNQLRSYCYVIDCVTAILTVLIKGKSGEAYNISNPKSIVTIHEIAEAFAEATGQKVVFEIPTESEKLGFNRMTCSALDSTKLEALGWQAKYDVQLGVYNTLTSI